jgi:hypothetical protein
MRTVAIRFATIAASAIFLWCACAKRNADAPVPLPEDQIPTAVSQAFNSSDKETQVQVAQYVSEFESHDYPAAFEDIQQIFHNKSLTRDQRTLLARALMTTSQKVQEAASGGDQRADEALRSYTSTK